VKLYFSEEAFIYAILLRRGGGVRKKSEMEVVGGFMKKGYHTSPGV